MSISKNRFGTLNRDEEVSLYTISNAAGLEVQIINFGGIITSLKTPDRNGNFGNIVLGYKHLEEYLADPYYFGAIIGRYANRIDASRFTLNGTEYQLTINDGRNHLHGGKKGLDKVLWRAEITGDASLKLSYRSADGDEGYPGNLDVSVTYTLNEQNHLMIDYEAETDKSTPVNLTAHSYFNLTANPANTILSHTLKIMAEKYTPVNDHLIPTGEIKRVAGTPFDFRNTKQIGTGISGVRGGYDHNYVLINQTGKTGLAAELHDPETGRNLMVYTTEPGIQFYSGNFLDGKNITPSGISYNRYAGLCLEPQHFPNSPNEPDFPEVILHPGKKYTSQTVYSFSVTP